MIPSQIPLRNRNRIKKIELGLRRTKLHFVDESFKTSIKLSHYFRLFKQDILLTTKCSSKFNFFVSWQSPEDRTAAATSTPSSTRPRLWPRTAGSERSLTFPSGSTSTAPQTWTRRRSSSSAASPTHTASTVRPWPSSSTEKRTSGRKGRQSSPEDFIIRARGFVTAIRFSSFWWIITINESLVIFWFSRLTNYTILF